MEETFLSIPSNKVFMQEFSTEIYSVDILSYKVLFTDLFQVGHK